MTAAPAAYEPLLKTFFTVSYVALAAFVGAFADSMPKWRVMFISNSIKIAGCSLLFFDVHPLMAYAVVGLGAAAYSPAKYGILTEYLPASKLVIANGWIETLTVGAIILGTVVGGVLIHPEVGAMLMAIDFPGINFGLDSSVHINLMIIGGFYLLASVLNLYIPDTGVDHKPLQNSATYLIHEFSHCSSAARRDTMERPRPRPSPRAAPVLSSWQNSSNTRCCWSVGMPMPVSTTTMRRRVAPCRQPINTAPWRV